MKYELVLQWPMSSIKDYDNLIGIEEAIIEGIRGIRKVDGHDAGSSEMNIFIFTDHPKLAFERVEQIPYITTIMSHMKATYHHIRKDEFTVLYPAGLKSVYGDGFRRASVRRT